MTVIILELGLSFALTLVLFILTVTLIFRPPPEEPDGWRTLAIAGGLLFTAIFGVTTVSLINLFINQIALL